VVSVLVQILTGVETPFQADIGLGPRVHDSGLVAIDPAVVSGCNCTMRHGVTIGKWTPQGGVRTRRSLGESDLGQDFGCRLEIWI
jgi:serine acetyltransferase